MRFESDEVKNRVNVRKHRFHLADATEMFEGPFLARPDTREEYGRNDGSAWASREVEWLLSHSRWFRRKHSDYFPQEGHE
jgi:uncharacterized DUF497 family protein